jgi:UPF0716 protein FxsA
MFKFLATLFIVIPAVEIFILFQFGSMFGAFNTFLIVITTGILGAALAQREGIAVINNIQTDLSTNKLPANEMISALLVFGGGLLLLTPGFITDIVGLTMILPFTRFLYISLFKDLFKKGVINGNVQVFTSNSFNRQSQTKSENPGHIDEVIEAEFKKKD